MKIRSIDVSVISDLHLGTIACKPKKILKYLKSIHPNILILNGDIIDSWRFSRNYFPKNHLKVIRQILKIMEKGTPVYYITGNHDEVLRRFNQVQIGNLKIVNQVVLELEGTKTWIFHGDIYDHIVRKWKWFAKLGAATYGFLALINKQLNNLLAFAGFNEIMIYKKFKNFLVKDHFVLSKFEKAVGHAAAAQNYNTVICGHTHSPKYIPITTGTGDIQYLNCGDWVENFTAAEYFNRQWHLYRYEDADDELPVSEDFEHPERKQIYSELLSELALSNLNLG